MCTAICDLVGMRMWLRYSLEATGVATHSFCKYNAKIKAYICGF